MHIAAPILLLATSAYAYVDVGHLIARQTSAARPTGLPDGECLSAIMDIGLSAPRPPSEIISVMTQYFMTATGTYDAQCGWQTALPGSLAPEWNRYQSSVLSWYNGHSSEINSALSKCPADYSSSVGPCTLTLAGASAPDPTAAPKNAAAQPTNYVGVAAAAVVGVLGAVAAL